MLLRIHTHNFPKEVHNCFNFKKRFFTEIPRQSAHKDLKKSQLIITITPSFFSIFMTENKPRRKLAAILAVDVVNFSMMMGEDEDRTLKNLKACRALTDESITANHGRVFGSAVNLERE